MSANPSNPQGIGFGFGPDPQPHDGCDTCADLARRRKLLHLADDLSGVTDCNVLIRRHPHGECE